jgi:ribosomal protein S18 acetylase RimI-like enzyme
MEIDIRYLEEGDLDSLRDDIVEMWSSHHLNNKRLISKNSLVNKDLHKYFKKSLDRKKGFSLIALVDGHVVGLIRVEEQDLEDFFSYKKAYIIDNLVIKMGFRRKGIATKLINKVREIAKENKIDVLRARIYSFNEPAMKLFEDKGFNCLYSEYFCVI